MFIMGILILGGSVGAKVSLRDSDFDYSTPNPLGRMADRRQSMYNAFTGDYDIKSCWGSKNAQANIPMLHVTGIDRRSRYSCSIDFSSTTHIGPLALELSGLPLKERIIIIAAKLFFKKLHLIYRNRLTSSSFAVAYLCFRKDVNTLERSFGKFMAYYAGFDFHRYRMTSNGPKLKPLPGATYEAYDIHALNAANPVPGIINLIVAMF
uniref:Uncharacterized protein n=1 Tax=Panagrolaimus superbus TaxID=310955 RepID=A0A914YDK3_9BILA